MSSPAVTETNPSLERYRDLLSPDELAQLAEAVERTLLPAIRVNTLKIDVAEARDTWPAWYGWQVQQVPFCATGWQLGACREPPTRTLEHKMGFFYAQEAASMLPAELFRFEAQARPVILDMAASPGGKTTHLACKARDRGLIVANDTSASRIAALCTNLRDWGATCTAVTNYPGERFGGWFPEAFDAVLLDAPCSGESLRTAERRKSRPVSAKERQRLHARQVQLLVSAFQALRPGGQLVYATCTLAPEEDEAVLDALLKLYPQQATVEAMDHVLPIPAPGLVSDGERNFDPQVRQAARLWPHLYDTSGFFAALLGKRGSVAAPLQPPPSRPLAEAGFQALSEREANHVFDSLQQAYGFDLGAVVQEYALVLWRREERGGRKEQVYAFPELFLSRFGALPCAAAGIRVGELSEDGGVVPSHELVARFGARFTQRRLALSEEQVEVWLAGRDLRGLEGVPCPSGTVVLTEDSRQRFLGLAKVLQGRIRNLLPRRLIY